MNERSPRVLTLAAGTAAVVLGALLLARPAAAGLIMMIFIMAGLPALYRLRGHAGRPASRPPGVPRPAGPADDRFAPAGDRAADRFAGADDRFAGVDRRAADRFAGVDRRAADRFAGVDHRAEDRFAGVDRRAEDRRVRR